MEELIGSSWDGVDVELKTYDEIERRWTSMEGLASVKIYTTAQSEYDTVVDSVLRICRELGFSEAGADDVVAPSEVTPSSKDRLSLYAGEGAIENEVTFTFLADEWSGLIDSILIINTSAENIEPSSTNQGEESNDFVQTFIDLIRGLAEDIDPVFITSYNRALMDGQIGPLPPSVMPDSLSFDLDRIPWLGIYSESMIEQFGGRQRVLDTPAWHVEELDNGSILIITTEEPWANYRHKQPADRYLLDGDDSAAF